MSDKKVPVRDKNGNIIGERGADHAGEKEVFNPRPGGLAAAAAAAKAKREAAEKEYRSPIKIKKKS